MLKKRSVTGFTLTEILITMAIVGMLAGLAIPGYFRTVEQSRRNEAITTLNIIHMGQKIYRLNNASFWDDDGTPTAAEISAALNIDISPIFYTTWTTWTINGGTDYTVRLSRNNTQGGDTSWWVQIVGLPTGAGTITQNP